jgi:hypothetical protein
MGRLEEEGEVLKVLGGMKWKRSGFPKLPLHAVVEGAI